MNDEERLDDMEAELRKSFRALGIRPGVSQQAITIARQHVLAVIRPQIDERAPTFRELREERAPADCDDTWHRDYTYAARECPTCAQLRFRNPEDQVTS